MPQYNRLPRKPEKIEIQDEFVSFVDHATMFANKHKSVLLTAILVGFVAWTGFVLWGKNRERQLLQNAQALYLADTSKSKAAYEEIASQQSGVTAAIARLELLKLDLKDQKPLEAIAQIDAAIPTAPLFVKRQLEISKAQILWDLKRHDDALSALKPALAESEEVVGSYPKFLQAQILEDSGKAEAADAIYQALAAPTAKDSVIQEWARARLVLDSKQGAKSE